MILLLCVDHLFLTGKEKIISECKKNLMTEFEVKYLGMKHYFLGLEVWQFPDEIFLNQGIYSIEILKRFGMLDCKEMNTLMVEILNLVNDDSSERIDVTLYRQSNDSLMYLTNTRPNICFVVSTLNQYMVDPRHIYLVATKHVMR